MRRTNGKQYEKKKVSVLSALLQTVKELCSTFRCEFVEELGKIAVIMQIIIPVVIAKAGSNMIEMILISCGLTIAVKYIKEVGYKLNHVTEQGFPVPVKRFTNVDRNGFIDIKEEDTQEAILYLCDVEDYLKRKGLL